MIVGKSRMRRGAEFGFLGRAHIGETINTIYALLLPFERISFTIPETSRRVEAARQNGLLRGAPLRTICHPQPLPAACTCDKLFEKWRGISAYWNVELDSLQKLLSI